MICTLTELYAAIITTAAEETGSVQEIKGYLRIFESLNFKNLNLTSLSDVYYALLFPSHMSLFVSCLSRYHGNTASVNIFFAVSSATAAAFCVF